MSSPASTTPAYPCQNADTSRQDAVRHRYRISVAVYPDGAERVTVTRADPAAVSAPQTFCPLGSVECPFDPRRLCRKAESARRSARRVRARLDEIARCNSLDHLITLTAGSHFTSRSHAMSAFSAFLADRRHGRWLRALVGGYIVVAEPFTLPAGGWHVHVAIAGRLSAAALHRLRTSWTAFLLAVYGIPAPMIGRFWRVHVSAPRSWHSPATLAAYLGKHLGAPHEGQKSYRYAIGMASASSTVCVAELTSTQARELIASYGTPERICHPRTGAVLGWTVRFRDCTRPPPVRPTRKDVAR